MERCWRNKFYGEQCLNEGTWATNAALAKQSGYQSFMSAVRWCDEHKHETDVPVAQAKGASPDAGKGA
jgi:hypothetical protein